MLPHLMIFPLLTIALIAACTPEATSPQGAAAVSQVVPVAVPDGWCPATAATRPDTSTSRDRAKCQPSLPMKSDSQPGGTTAQTWTKIQGQPLRSDPDSAAAASDTPK
jgi:hypothetical protein